MVVIDDTINLGGDVSVDERFNILGDGETGLGRAPLEPCMIHFVEVEADVFAWQRHEGTSKVVRSYRGGRCRGEARSASAHRQSRVRLSEPIRASCGSFRAATSIPAPGSHRL